MALRDQPYFPFYVQDMMTDEKLNECCAATHGIYIKGIMCLMHKSSEYGVLLLKQKDKQTDNQIENFACKLVRHLPYSEAEIAAAIKELLDEKVLILEGDKLIQKRMVKDNDISLKRSKAGSKGGSKTQTFAKAKTQASYENEYENENENNSSINIEFEEFWNLYDKKVGRPKSEKKWKKLKPEEREAIMAFIPKYKQAEPNKKFRQNPQTFFNNRTWEDEIVMSAEKGNDINSFIND